MGEALLFDKQLSRHCCACFGSLVSLHYDFKQASALVMLWLAWSQKHYQALSLWISHQQCPALIIEAWLRDDLLSVLGW